MTSRSPPRPDPALPRNVLPTEAHAELAVREAGVLMAPIVRWLLRHGVSYPAFSDRLKEVFLSVAREELEQSGAKVTHSALSVLSGLHRKDVRALSDTATVPTVSPSVPLASQVFTRWISHPDYRDAHGKPRTLPRTGEGLSFERLMRELSTDVHPRTVLDELLRLGLVTLDGEDVRVQTDAFIPAKGLAELTALFSANAADHLAAAVHNLTLRGPKFLEQSVFADGLTAHSANELAGVARELWARSFETMVSQAQARVDADQGKNPTTRMRFGVYFYSEAVEPAAPAEPAERKP